MQAFDDAESTPTPTQPAANDLLDTEEFDASTPGSRKRRKSTGPSSDKKAGVMKDLTLEQKAIVRMNVSRETAEGFVKCCYCEKEISSRNVDRWGSHLRGCVKTPDEVKAQIVPIRIPSGPNASGVSASTTGNGAHGSTGASAAAAASGSAAAMFAAGHSLINSQQGSANPSTTAFLAHTATGNLQTALAGSYNEVFKVHVSKDYMKFNAAHFIAYKVLRRLLRVALWTTLSN